MERGTYLSFGSGLGNGFGREATWMLLRALFFCLPGHTASVCCLWAVVSTAAVCPCKQQQQQPPA